MDHLNYLLSCYHLTKDESWLDLARIHWNINLNISDKLKAASALTYAQRYAEKN